MKEILNNREMKLIMKYIQLKVWIVYKKECIVYDINDLLWFFQYKLTGRWKLVSVKFKNRHKYKKGDIIKGNKAYFTKPIDSHEMDHSENFYLKGKKIKKIISENEIIVSL